MREEIVAAILDMIYCVPSDADNGDRRFHADIDDMSEGQLREELRLASFRFSIEHNCGRPSSSWLQQGCLRLKEGLYGPS